MLNSEYVRRGVDGKAVRRQLATVDELLELLSAVFGILLPDNLDVEKVKEFFDKGTNPQFHSPDFIRS